MLLADSPVRVLGRDGEGNVQWLIPLDGLSALGATETGDLVPVRLRVRTPSASERMAAKRTLVHVGRWTMWTWSTKPASVEGLILDYKSVPSISAAFAKPTRVGIQLVEPRVDEADPQLPTGTKVLDWVIPRGPLAVYLLVRRAGRNNFLMFVRRGSSL